MPYKDKEKGREYHKEYSKEYYQRSEVKVRIKEYSKEYYQKNKKNVIKRIKKYNQRPEVKARKKEYRNRPEVKQYYKEYSQRPEVKVRKNEYHKEYKKSKRKNNINFRIKDNLRRELSYAFKRYSKTGKIKSSCEYGIDYGAIINHLKPFPKDIENYEVDHIIPLSLFNFNNPEQIRIAFLPENHQWLTITENREKGNKLIIPH